MKRGTVFIDDNDYSIDARLLFYIEDAVQDGVTTKDGNRRTISKHIHFMELKEMESLQMRDMRRIGITALLIWRRMRLFHSWMQTQRWLIDGVEEKAKGMPSNT